MKDEIFHSCQMKAFRLKWYNTMGDTMGDTILMCCQLEISCVVKVEDSLGIKQ